MENNCRTTVRPGSVKEFFRSSYFWKPFLSIIAGALLGFLYFYFVGCKSGSCAITSDPFASMITGGILGFLITSSPCARCKS
ncbi:MAG TPA: DUF6132 family protein [Bacteroidales bacterium]|nr:DUF6132 family protein [Bacteroidales bacterium]